MLVIWNLKIQIFLNKKQTAKVPLLPNDNQKGNISAENGEIDETGERKEVDKSIIMIETPEGIVPHKLISYVKYSFVFICFYSLYRFTFQMVYVFNTQLAVQKDVEQFVETSKKNSVNANLQAIYAITNCIGPLVGFISDKTPILNILGFDIGRRKPYILFGMLFFFITFMARPFFIVPGNDLYFYIYSALTVLGSFFSIFALVAYSALFPDLFHPTQFNIVSSLNGLASLVGETAGKSIFGALWQYLPEYINYLICTIIGVVGVLPIFLFREGSSGKDQMITKIKKKKRKGKFSFKKLIFAIFQKLINSLTSFISPFLHWNFACCFFSRFISQIGIGSIDCNFLFFLSDCVRDYSLFGYKGLINSDTEANALIGAIRFIFGLICTFLFPLLSQYITRKMCIFIGTAMMVISYFVFIFSKDFTVIVLFSAIAGGGFSGFTAVYFALIAECLPNKKEAAKDLSIFTLASIIPSALGLPIMGKLVNIGQEMSLKNLVVWSDFGYSILFFSSIGCIMIGIVLIGMIKPKKN